MAFVAALSFLAGMTDAIGLIMGGTFVSFMTGNTTRLGLAVSEEQTPQVLRLLMVLALFVVGNAIGEFISRRIGRGRGGQTEQTEPLGLPGPQGSPGSAGAQGQQVHQGRTGVLIATSLLLTGCAALAGYGLDTAAICCAVLAMGVLNAAFEKLHGQSVGLTYVTGALAHIGQALGKYAADRERPQVTGHMATFGGLLCGVIAGAVLQHQLPGLALWSCACFAWLMVLTAWRLH
jgi:uncharacterized membrane protein YoaK (UPF0700 family)